MNVYRLARRAYFSAAHKIDDQTSGHNYILEAYVEGPIAPDSGMLIAVSRLDNLLKEVTVSLDHKYLNSDVNYFKTAAPTAVNVARYCHDFLKPLIHNAAPDLRLQKVRLYESDDLWVDCGAQVTPEI